MRDHDGGLAMHRRRCLFLQCRDQNSTQPLGPRRSFRLPGGIYSLFLRVSGDIMLPAGTPRASNATIGALSQCGKAIEFAHRRLFGERHWWIGDQFYSHFHRSIIGYAVPCS